MSIYNAELYYSTTEVGLRSLIAHRKDEALRNSSRFYSGRVKLDVESIILKR